MPKPPPPSTVPQAPFKIAVRKASKRNQQVRAARLRKRLAQHAEEELDGLDSAPESDPETDKDRYADSASDGGWGDGVSSDEDEQSTDDDVVSDTKSNTHEKKKTQRAVVQAPIEPLPDADKPQSYPSFVVNDSSRVEVVAVSHSFQESMAKNHFTSKSVEISA
jgi:hypothetical protein